MSDEVRNFLEHNKALCSQALSYQPDVILRAAEMIASAERGMARERTSAADANPT